MKLRSFILTTIVVASCLSCYAQNLSIYRSELGVEEMSEKIISIIKAKDLIYFETVNHDEIARSRGVKIDPTRSILFEDPDLTTTLIGCQQTTALDLPLEFLVWEEHGDVYYGFVDPKLMKKKYMISGCDETIESLTKVMVRIANEALRN